MSMRALEKLLLFIAISYGGVLFLYNLAQNRRLLDLSVPIMAGVLFVLWLIFGNRQHQH
jgi:hypothetical protein